MMNNLNKLILSYCIFILTTLAFSQGAQHKIVEVFSNENLRINIGQDSGVKIGDYFQVFGKSEIIHPATGQLMVKENVYIGKLEVIEVEKTESICKIIEQKKFFQVSDKIRKVSKTVDIVIKEERQTQFEFENPQKRDYAETIYSKKPNPTRDISAKKLWFDGPFLLEKGMVKINIDIAGEFEFYKENTDNQSFSSTYNFFEFRPQIPISISYGLFENIQLNMEIPFLLKSRKINSSYYGYSTSNDSYSYISGFNVGLSDISLTGLYALPNQDYDISIGASYSLATDNGWQKLITEGIIDIEDIEMEFKLPLSNGYNIFSILGSAGIKQKNLLAFGELKYNFNGNRDDYEEIIISNYRAYVDTFTVVKEYNPTNNFEIKLVGSFFINDRTKLRSEINIFNNFRPIDKDSDEDQKGMILLKPSIHRLMTQSFIWSFGIFFPLKNDYDFSYLGLNMSFTWINY